MRTFYNEWDEPTAAWLTELCNRRHLPQGHVDTRSIRDVRPDDLAGYGQCHFFAGIGGWPLALRWAGLENVPGIWTGSPPCQPFSVAGKGLAQSDERHLAPVWLGLIKECRPPVIFGEQVADAIGKGWLDDLFDALEREGYACAAAVLPACGVGAPHIRKRLFFGAVRMADANEIQRRRQPDSEKCQSYGQEAGWVESNRIVEPDLSTCGLANTDNARPQGWAGMPERSDEQSVRPGGMEGRPADPRNGFWSGADWLGCRDGKFRPVEPRSFPLADGLPARVGRLRGYGNAIVPQVAAEFVKAFLESVGG